MGLGEKQAAKLMELAQHNCDEPVVTAAIVLRRGQTASRNLAGLAPEVSRSRWAESKEKAPAFPSNTLVVVDRAEDVPVRGQRAASAGR